MTSVISQIKIIDTDTHVVEPPDLWTSRLPSRLHDQVPHVRWDDQASEEAWLAGAQRLGAVGAAAMAGWNEYPPHHPRRWSDIDPVMYDATARAARMDEYGIHAQILYPNVALFSAKMLLDMKDPSVQLDCNRAYNDFQVEWGSAAPGRFVPMASLPFWDLEASLAELRRCADLGHRGVIFTQDPGYFGLPVLTDRHWDPLW